MKASLYNHSFHLPDDTFLIFNFYTLTLIALQLPESNIAEEILNHPNTCSSKRSSSLKKLLIEKGFIINDSIDELELLRISNYKTRAQQNHMGLTIVPTLSCNFQCRLTERGPIVFEVNPRFTGATATGAALGFNEVEAVLRRLLLDEPIQSVRERLHVPENLVCSRYVTEMIVPRVQLEEIQRRGYVEGNGYSIIL